MRKIPNWIWILGAAGIAFYLYSKYKATTIPALPPAGSVAQPTGTASLASDASQIATGLTTLFQNV